MLGHLVPCGGGKAMALCKPRLVLSRRSTTDDGDGVPKNDAELRFVEGWWYIRRVELGRSLAVNGNDCDAAQLKPNDVLTVGGKFYRITYQPPGPVAPASPLVDASALPSSTTFRAESSAVEIDSTSAPLKPEYQKPAVASAALGMLIPCGGGPSVTLRKPKIIIGRSPSCDLVIPQRNISSKHCALDLNNGYWQMSDLESTNGTTVDGMTYLRKWVLPGSVIGLSNKRFRLEYQPKGEQPSLSEDDEVVLPNRSLLELAGVSKSGMDRLIRSLPADEPTRSRWNLEE